jgi:hypothetical protein
MTNDAQNGSTPDQARPSIAAPNRRTLLRRGIGAAPVVLGTLASRSALGTGTGAFCTRSLAMSGNLSRGPIGSCGVSPGCWKNKAKNEWYIQDGTKKIQQIFDVFADTGGKPQWRISTPGNAANVRANVCNGNISYFKGSFMEGLNGTVHAYCVLKSDANTYKSTSPNVVEITGNGFLSQIICGALNAAFFRDSGVFPSQLLFPYSLLEVINLVNSQLRSKTFKTNTDATTATGYLNKLFSDTITDGYECGMIDGPSSQSYYVPDPIT